MTDVRFTSEPESVHLEDSTIYAEATARPDGVVDVLVVISRRPDEPQMHASEVDARLVDDSDQELEVVRRDEGLLVEVGGGLGHSTNAHFEFAQGAAPPRDLTVRYRDEEARFVLRPEATGS